MFHYWLDFQAETIKDQNAHTLLIMHQGTLIQLGLPAIIFSPTNDTASYNLIFTRGSVWGKAASKPFFILARPILAYLNPTHTVLIRPEKLKIKSIESRHVFVPVQCFRDSRYRSMRQYDRFNA